MQPARFKITVRKAVGSERDPIFGRWQWQAEDLSPGDRNSWVGSGTTTFRFRAEIAAIKAAKVRLLLERGGPDMSTILVDAKGEILSIE